MLLGDPEQATIRGGYSEAFERQGIGGFTGIYGPNPGSTLSLTRNASTGLVGPGESWPVLLRETDRLYPAPFPETPTFPIPIRPNRADNINAFHPDIEVASARSWTVGPAARADAATWRSKCATSARAASISGRRSTTTSATSSRTASSTSSSSRWRTCAPTTRAGGNRSGSFAYFGAGQRHQSAADLSRLPERPPRRRQPGGLHRRRRDVDQHDARRAARAHQSESELRQPPTITAANAQRQCRRRPRQQPDVPQQRARRGPAGQLLRRQSRTPTTSTSATAAPSAPITRCSSSCAAGCRTGLSLNGSYQYALEEGSEFLGFHFGRASTPTQRQHPSRDQDAVGLDDSGRPRPALRPQPARVAQRDRRRTGSSTAPAASSSARRTSATCGWSA